MLWNLAGFSNLPLRSFRKLGEAGRLAKRLKENCVKLVQRDVVLFALAHVGSISICQTERVAAAPFAHQPNPFAYAL